MRNEAVNSNKKKLSPNARILSLLMPYLFSCSDFPGTILDALWFITIHFTHHYYVNISFYVYELSSGHSPLCLRSLNSWMRCSRAFHSSLNWLFSLLPLIPAVHTIVFQTFSLVISVWPELLYSEHVVPFATNFQENLTPHSKPIWNATVYWFFVPSRCIFYLFGLTI